MPEKKRAAQAGGTEGVFKQDFKHLASTPPSDSRLQEYLHLYTTSGGVRDALRLTSLVHVDSDRRVAHVEVGPFRIGSLWVVGCESGTPIVSWPRTSRGYPIIEVEDPLRSEIEALVLAAEAGRRGALV